jgi:DNA-binding NtrC family response regulator
MQIGKYCRLDHSANDSLPRLKYSPTRILMVDDDPCLVELNAEVLRRHGYEVDIACDGKDGWEELQTNRYNLLITENDLPRLTGVGLVMKLRSACMSLPVIIAVGILPSWKSAEYPWLLKSTKLFKPYASEDLLGLVKSILPVPARIRAEIAPAQNWQSQPSPAFADLIYGEHPMANEGACA